eukprot:TCONS_00003868-protein
MKAGTVPKPPPVIDGEYSMFGHTQKTDDEIIQPLESQGLKRLYAVKSKKFDHIVEMKKLNHSILVNYMELLDIMIDAPGSEERVKKIEEIKLMFINLHHLINEFRPHQARETLRIMLHRQKLQRVETTERLRENIEKARTILKNSLTNLNTPSAPSTSGNTSKEQQEVSETKPNLSDNKKVISTEHQDTLASLQHKIMADILDGIP